MKKIFASIGLIAVVFFVSSSGWAYGKLTPKEIMAKYSGSVVRLVYQNDNGDIDTIGSGFICMSNGVILTNYHVVCAVKPVYVVTADGQEYKEIELLQYSKEDDFAVLRIKAEGLSAVKLALPTKRSVGEPVVVIGNPKGLDFTISDGLLSAMRTEEGRPRIQISAPISPGSSGSPVFDESGAVIGMAAAGILEGQNLNFAIPIELMTPFLNSQPQMPLADLPLDPEYGGGNSNAEVEQEVLSDDDFDRFIVDIYHKRSEINDALRFKYLQMLRDEALDKPIEVNEHMLAVSKFTEESLKIIVSVVGSSQDMNAIIMSLAKDMLEQYAAMELEIEAVKAIAKNDAEAFGSAMDQAKKLRINLGITTDKLVAEYYLAHEDRAAALKGKDNYLDRVLLDDSSKERLGIFLVDTLPNRIGLILSDYLLPPTVMGTIKASPARFARLYPGDKIVGVNGGPKFTTATEFILYLSRIPSGQTVELEVISDNAPVVKRMKI